MDQTTPQRILAADAPAGDQRLSGWYSWPSVALLSVFCCPVGLYLLWKHPRWSTQTKRIWTGVWAACVILGALIDHAERKANSQELAQANQLWSDGKRDEAVQHYRKLAEKSWDKLSKDELPTVVNRLIDFDVEKGEEASARHWIEKSRDNEVALNLDTGKSLLKTIENEEKAIAAEKKAAEVAKGKLPAFRRVMTKYKNSPDRFASSAEREKFNEELAAVQNAFSAIPFDPTANREDAKEIVGLFEKEIEHQYEGQLYRELEEEVREIYAKLIQ
jgi:hypothetical protein